MKLGQQLLSSFLKTFGPIVAVGGALASLASIVLVDSSAVVEARWVVGFGIVTASLSACLLLVLLHALIKTRDSFARSPAVIRSLGPPPEHPETVGILVLEPSKLFSAGVCVTILRVANETERVAGTGFVLAIQDDGKIQILVEELFPGFDDRLRGGFAKNALPDVGSFRVRPFVRRVPHSHVARRGKAKNGNQGKEPGAEEMNKADSVQEPEESSGRQVAAREDSRTDARAVLEEEIFVEILSREPDWEALTDKFSEWETSAEQSEDPSLLRVLYHSSRFRKGAATGVSDLLALADQELSPDATALLARALSDADLDGRALELIENYGSDLSGDEELTLQKAQSALLAKENSSTAIAYLLACLEHTGEPLHRAGLLQQLGAHYAADGDNVSATVCRAGALSGLSPTNRVYFQAAFDAPTELALISISIYREILRAEDDLAAKNNLGGAYIAAGLDPRGLKCWDEASQEGSAYSAANLSLRLTAQGFLGQARDVVSRASDDSERHAHAISQLRTAERIDNESAEKVQELSERSLRSLKEFANCIGTSSFPEEGTWSCPGEEWQISRSCGEWETTLPMKVVESQELAGVVAFVLARKRPYSADIESVWYARCDGEGDLDVLEYAGGDFERSCFECVTGEVAVAEVENGST